MPEVEQTQTAEGQQPVQEQQEVSILAGKTFTSTGADGATKAERYDEKGVLIEDKPEEAGKEKQDTSETGEKAETPAKDPEEKEGEETEEAEAAKLIKPDDPKGVQERIHELVGQRRKAERETTALKLEVDNQKTELQSLKDAVAELRSGKKPEGEKPPGEPPAVDPAAKPERPAKPKEDDFDSYEDFEKARDKHLDDLSDYFERLGEWRVNNYAAEQRKAAENAVHAQWVAEGAVKFKDFAQVVEGQATLRLYTDDMMRAVNDSGDIHGLAYHLAKNPAELKRIAALSPSQQVREVTRIDLELQGKQQKTETNQPAPEKEKAGAGIKRTTTVDEPIKPVGATGGAGPFDSAAASATDIKRHLDAQAMARLRQA